MVAAGEVGGEGGEGSKAERGREQWPGVFISASTWLLHRALHTVRHGETALPLQWPIWARDHIRGAAVCFYELSELSDVWPRHMSRAEQTTTRWRHSDTFVPKTKYRSVMRDM